MRADAILRADEAKTKSEFAFPEIARRRAATYKTIFHGGFMPSLCAPKGDTGDTLIVEWQVSGPLGDGTLVLQDEPCVSIYALKIRRVQIGSRPATNTALAGIFGSQNAFTRATVCVDSLPPATRWFACRLMNSSTEGLAHVDFKAVLTAQNTFLVLTLGRGGYDSLVPPVPPFVPEMTGSHRWERKSRLGTLHVALALSLATASWTIAVRCC